VVCPGCARALPITECSSAVDLRSRLICGVRRRGFAPWMHPPASNQPEFPQWAEHLHDPSTQFLHEFGTLKALMRVRMILNAHDMRLE
jgi:hypothetical protein